MADATGALAAMNAALNGEEPPDEPVVEDTPASEDATGDDAGGVSEGGDSDAAGGADKADPDGEPGSEDAGEGEPEGEGSETNIAAEAEELGVSLKRANGQFKSKEELATDVAAAKTAKGGEPGAGKDAAAGKAAAKKEPDPLNDPIPKDLKQETQQRIRTLIDRTKGAEERATKAETDFNYLVEGVKATGTTPEQYGEVLSFMSLFNSGDPKQQGQALELLEDMADKLATLLGRERTVSDPLVAHPDLKQALQAGQITKQFAVETARLRNQGAFRQQLNTQAQTEHQQQQAAERELAEVRQELDQLEVHLKATDPLYARKKAAILPTLKAVLPQLPPRQRKDAFMKVYNEARVAAPVVRQNTPTNQPLRANKGGAPAGGGGKMAEAGPASALDAINAALANVGK